MAEKRMISSGIFDDEWFGTQEPLTQIIWIGLIATVADDQGRFLFNTSLIRSKLFPYKDIQLIQIEVILEFICSAEKIKRYTSVNKDYCQIVHWWRYQQPSWAMPSKYPAPEGWIDRIRYHTANRVIKEANWNTPGGFIDNSLPSGLGSGLGNDETRGIEKEELRVRGDKEEIEDYVTTTVIPAIDGIAGEVYRKFENEICILTPAISDTIDGWLQDYSADWIKSAIDEAVKNNVRKPVYINKILQNWKVNGPNGSKPVKPAQSLEDQGYHRIGSEK